MVEMSHKVEDGVEDEWNEETTESVSAVDEQLHSRSKPAVKNLSSAELKT